MKITYILLVIMVFNAKTLRSQTITDIIPDGIYETCSEGIKIFYSGDSSQYCFLDTTQAIHFNCIAKIKKKKSKYAGGYSLTIQFNETASLQLQLLTQRNIEKRLPIIADNQIIASPFVMTEISDGKLSLTGINEDLIDLLQKRYK